MGRKIHPYSFRLGITKDWKSKWFADKSQYAELVIQDEKIRRYLHSEFGDAGIDCVNIERNSNEISITIHVAKPGVVIGKGGSGVEAAEKEIKKITKSRIKITAVQVKVPELQAKLVADFIARRMQRRVSYKYSANSAIQTAISKGAKGIKISVAGLLGGNPIARTEVFEQGPVPTQTLRADIDYAQVHCKMMDGIVGIKVWIYKGELEL
jgi:small subunit ribosomal protein S3